MRFLYVVPVFMLLCLTCRQSIKEGDLKLEILMYWNNGDVDDVAITDISLNGKTAKVSASLVFLNDTLRELIYTFERFKKSWKVVDGPGDNMMRMALSSYIKDTKRSVLKNNMHTFQLALEDFCTLANGKYPADLTVTIKEAYPDCKSFDSSTVLKLLPSHFLNPYDRNDLAVCSSKNKYFAWSIDCIGKVVYIPRNLNGKTAGGYIIKGATDEGFSSLVLSF